MVHILTIFLYKTISALLIFYEPAELQLNSLSTMVLCFYVNKEFLELYFLMLIFIFLVKASLIEYLVLMDELKVT